MGCHLAIWLRCGAVSLSTETGSWRLGMSTAAQPNDHGGADARVTAVEITDEHIVAHLADGRTISVPLSWSWRLADATAEQRASYEIFGEGTGIRWPEVDEDISVRGMLDGVPARRPRS